MKTQKKKPSKKFTQKQEQWLQLMESGKYRQCRSGALKSRGNYCCLGLAAEFVLKLEQRPSMETPGNVEFYDNYNASDSTLEVREWYSQLRLHDCVGLDRGFTRSCSLVAGNTGQSLTELNDYGATFKQIAKAIRNAPWRVFSNFKQPANAGQH